MIVLRGESKVKVERVIIEALMGALRVARKTLSLLSNFEESLSPESRQLLHCATDSARQLTFPLYLVGGPVRDLLLGRRSVDLDLVVEGKAERLAAAVADRLHAKLTAHRRFGTATVTLGTHRLDLATARKESYPHPGALPKVAPGSLDEDLHRRDFTMNAIALELGGGDGRIVDPCGGRDDLDKGLVRALHRISFRDDPTRILRAVRYEQRLGFRLEESTEAWMLGALAAGALSTISPFRLRREVDLILGEPSAKASVLRAGALGVWRALYPPLEDAGWIGRLREEGTGDRPVRFVAALAWPLTPDQGEALISRLNMPNSWSAAVRDVISLRRLDGRLSEEGLSRREVCGLLEGCSPDALSVLADYAGTPAAESRVRRYLEEWRYVKPSLGGRELIRLGVPHGPQIGEVLGLLKRARLEGAAANRQDESAMVREYLAAKGG